MNEKNIVAVILAAGVGRRMKSKKAKVLHKVAGLPMILHVVGTAYNIFGKNVIAVIGYQAERVKEVISKKYDIQYVYQKEQLGTGHAVKCALSILPEHVQNVLVLCGDVPLLKSQTIKDFIENHTINNYELTILGVKMENPYGYGRLVLDKNRNISAIVEETDTDENQKKINIVNSGIYYINKDLLQIYLDKITFKNAQKELYLTDIISLAYNDKRKIGMFLQEQPIEFIGVNSYEDLKLIKSYLNKNS